MAAVTDTNHYGLDQMPANDASIVSVTPFFLPYCSWIRLIFLLFVRSGFKAAFFHDDNKVESQSIFIPVQKLFPGLYNPVQRTDWHRAPSGAAPHPPVKTAPVWQKEGGVSADNDISVLNLQQEQSSLIQSLLILATSWI